MNTTPTNSQAVFFLVWAIASSIQTAELDQIALLSAGCITLRQAIDNLQEAITEVAPLGRVFSPVGKCRLKRALDAIHQNEVQQLSQLSAEHIDIEECIARLLRAQIMAMSELLGRDNLELLARRLVEHLECGGTE